MSDLVLVSWIAVNNDPYERERDRTYRAVGGKRVEGPTIMLLTDPCSPYAGRFSDAVLFRQGGAEDAFHRGIYDELKGALAERCPSLRVHPTVWHGDDPTDHQAIFAFLRERLPEVRRRFPGRELVIHVSPGTPSMQTVWVLMAETGFIEPPFTVVKSYRREERRGRPAAVPVSLGIDTFYKRYMAIRPRQGGGEPEIRWDPARFRSPILRELYRNARRIAALNVPVLILGERGTGKTTLASWIRFSSPYRREALDQSWPAVACGQYNTETMRAELFGYRKHAVTGATEDRAGLLHLANGDTLFLDEVGDVSRDLQRLLIKALEEGRYQPLGATKFEASEFRLITATNMPMSVLAERLDADFFDRIGSFRLRVPALREIPEDLDWLWDNVLAEAARRAKVASSLARLDEQPRAKLVQALRGHPLPGNIRDLFRVAYRFLAARADDLEPASQLSAVEDALSALETAATFPGKRFQEIVRGFAEGAPLDAQLVDGGPIMTAELLTELRAYLAPELRRLARERGVKVDEIADVGERTLRNWARKNAAVGPEE